MTLKVDLRQVIHALADALDLVGVDDVAHGKRVGVMAAECGRGAGLPAGEVAFLFDQVKDPIELIKWKDVLEYLEDTLDHCEDVSDMIRGVVMKYA